MCNFTPELHIKIFHVNEIRECHGNMEGFVISNMGKIENEFNKLSTAGP